MRKWAAMLVTPEADFDDFLPSVLRLFRQHPDVLEDVQRGYRHILIDEFQDVSPMWVA